MRGNPLCPNKQNIGDEHGEDCAGQAELIERASRGVNDAAVAAEQQEEAENRYNEGSGANLRPVKKTDGVDSEERDADRDEQDRGDDDVEIASLPRLLIEALVPTEGLRDAEGERGGEQRQSHHAGAKDSESEEQRSGGAEKSQRL